MMYATKEQGKMWIDSFVISYRLEETTPWPEHGLVANSCADSSNVM